MAIRISHRAGGKQASVDEMLNGMPSGVFVGNGFIRSERSVNIRGSLGGKWSVNTVGRLAVPPPLGSGFGQLPLDDKTQKRYISAGANPVLRFCPTFFHLKYPDKNVTEAECINAFPTNRPAEFQFIRTLRLLGKEKSPAGWRDFFICWHYLSSRQVTLQVLSAQMSLTSVFGMGTGGPSSQSIPTFLDGFDPSSMLKPSLRF